MLHRIVEDQASHTPTRTITETPDEYDFIEDLIEQSKPVIQTTTHHYLIKTQFRYPLPVLPKFSARFRPPHSQRNVFYGSLERQTSFYEAAYHWLQERIHVKDLGQTAEPRTHFTVEFIDPHSTDISKHKDIDRIMDRHDYSASHDFAQKHPNLSSIMYPSCREPQRGKCAAVFELMTLGEKPLSNEALFFIYNPDLRSCTIEGLGVEPSVTIPWGLVS